MPISFAVLEDSNALRIFSGQAISQLCDKMMAMALAWYITSQGSLRLVPWFLAVAALPHLLLAGMAGRWVSRWGSLKTVIATDLVRGALFLAAGLLWLSRQDAITASGIAIPFFFALAFFASCASALFNPAILSMPILLTASRADLLGRLTALIDSCFSLSNILGPAVAALLYPWIGLGGLLLANAFSYFVAAFLESRIRLQAAPAPKAQDIQTSATGTGRFPLERDSLLKFLLAAFFFMNVSLTPLIAFLPIFSKFQFHGKIGVLAEMETSLGVGTVLGSIALTVSTLRHGPGIRTIAGVLTIALMDLAFSLSRSPLLSCAALLALGFALSVVNVSLMTFFQARPAEQDVPRVMSWVNLISVGAIPFSMVLVGGLIERVNLRSLAVALSLALLALGLLTATKKEFRIA